MSQALTPAQFRSFEAAAALFTGRLAAWQGLLHFGRLKRVLTSAQVLLNGIEAVVVLTLTLRKRALSLKANHITT